MKNARSTWFVGLFVLFVFVSFCSQATGGNLEKKNLVIVPFDYADTVRVSIGDVVQLNAKNLPLTAKNINKTWGFSCDKEYVRLIASVPLDVEGPMGREIYFKALKAGVTQVKLLLQEEKKTSEEYVFTLKIE
jgi:hypothetical protein